jgi:hypothetical protein
MFCAQLSEGLATHGLSGGHTDVGSSVTGAAEGPGLNTQREGGSHRYASSRLHKPRHHSRSPTFPYAISDTSIHDAKLVSLAQPE